MKITSKAVFTFLTLAFAAQAAEATVVSVQFAGYVNIIKDTNHVLDSSIVLNTPFNVTYALETSTPPSFASPEFNRYNG